MNTQTQHKLRASYTYLHLWSSGQWEEAIKAYFKIDKYVSREMAEGLDYHKEWEEHIKKTKTMPAVFGGEKMSNPVCEGKLVIPVYDWLDLVVIPDCIDLPVIKEFKTGISESSDYARTYQPAIYAIGMVLLKRPVRYVDIHQYNQYSKKATFSRVVVTEKLLKDGLNFIETVGGEMHTYFMEQGLYDRYLQA
jgi:hypothetical protein